MKDSPAIVLEAESPELEQLAYEATAALEAASVGGNTYLARLREAGRLLSKAKEQCKHGNWLPWLKKHNISRTSAFRSIKAFSNVPAVEHLDDAIEVIAKKGEEQEKPLPDQNLVYCGRNCRVGLGPAKCKACEKERAKAAKKAREEALKRKSLLTPEQIKAQKLAEILDRGKRQIELAKSAINLSKRIRQIERWDIYRAKSGDREETFAEALYKAWKQLALNAPSVACGLCKGDVEPNPDSEPCTDCGGRGVLTAAEAQAIKERLDF